MPHHVNLQIGRETGDGAKRNHDRGILGSKLYPSPALVTPLTACETGMGAFRAVGARGPASPRSPHFFIAASGLGDYPDHMNKETGDLGTEDKQ